MRESLHRFRAQTIEYFDHTQPRIWQLGAFSNHCYRIPGFPTDRKDRKQAALELYTDGLENIVNMAEATTSSTDEDLTKRVDVARKCLNALGKNLLRQDGGLDESQASSVQLKTSLPKRKFNQETIAESLSPLRESSTTRNRSQHHHVHQQAAKRRRPTPTQESSSRDRPRIEVEIPDSNQSASPIDPEPDTETQERDESSDTQLQHPNHTFPPLDEEHETHLQTDSSSDILPPPPPVPSLGSPSVSPSSNTTHGHTPSFTDFDAMPSDCDGCCLHQNDCDDGCCVHSSIRNPPSTPPVRGVPEDSPATPSFTASRSSSRTPVRDIQFPIQPPPPVPDLQSLGVGPSLRNGNENNTGTRVSSCYNNEEQTRLDKLERQLKTLTEWLRRRHASDQKSLEGLLRALEGGSGGGGGGDDWDF